MTKFCPNCGNQMSDNAKFCMECGARLEDYSSGCAEIKDNVIQRSQVGAASVGKVEISPTINATATAAGGYACRICGAPAASKCGHCKTYICGKCLKKVYYVDVSDQDLQTIEQIISKPPTFFCKECFETSRIQSEAIDNGVVVYQKKWGYFTERELRTEQFCEKCKRMSFVFDRCELCGKIFCTRCMKKKQQKDRFGTYEGKICPFCNKEYSWRVI